MNITLILGWGVAIGATIASIMMTGAIGDYIDGGSIFIVVGGSLGALIATTPMDDLKKLLTLVKIVLKKDEIDLNQQIEDIVDMANIARKNGLLALEDRVSVMEDPFMKNGVMLILDGTDPELVKNVMETEVYFIDERHDRYAGIFDRGAAVSPAFGMVGTLIGLINMLKVLDDPSNLGPQMAVALITTFYGVLLANVLYTPISAQLRLKNQNEQLQKNIIIEGILSIQDGENPRVIRDKLRAFISKTDSATMDPAGGAAPEGGGE